MANRRKFAVPKDGTGGKSQFNDQTRNPGTQEALSMPSTVNTATSNGAGLDISVQHSSSTSPKKHGKTHHHHGQQHGYASRRKSKNFEILMNNSIGIPNQKSPPAQVAPALGAANAEAKEDKKQSRAEPEKTPKEFVYFDPGVKIGNGKFGPVNLIIHKGHLFALKIIPKTTIDKTKRIEHVKNEKEILLQLRKHAGEGDSRQDAPYSQAQSRNKNARAEQPSSDPDKPANYASEQRCFGDKEPLDFIVMLFETFVDEENVNFVFEYLPG